LYQKILLHRRDKSRFFPSGAQGTVLIMPTVPITPGVHGEKQEKKNLEKLSV
jgi:hypothetical protein